VGIVSELVKWLTHDDRKDLFEILVALALNVLFLALTALLLWPLGRLRLAFSLAKGYGLLWTVLGVTAILVIRLQGFLRVNLYDRANAYMASNLAVSCLLQIGWSAFAALTVHGFVSGASNWVAFILYFVGVVSCLVAFFAVSAVYQGTFYKLVSLPIALIGFLVFRAWPAGGRAVFGWFFRLF
jgi:hypothetical protein